MNDSYIGLRTDIIKIIPTNKKFLKTLDVGCATGALGRYLMDNEISEIVDGIEFDEAYATISSESYRRVFELDLNLTNVLDSLPLDSDYDLIILGDILEHCFYAELILKKLVSENLSKNGIVLISVPNIAHIDLIINVYLKGVWPRNSRGIFDSTHVRQFTKKDIVTMVSECGLTMEKLEINYRLRDSLNPPSFIGLLFFRFLKLIVPKLVSFQFLIRGKKIDPRAALTFQKI